LTPAELASLLHDFYREIADLVVARQTRARQVTAYDAHNPYQQVLGRQDVHLQWLSDAIASLTGDAPMPPAGDNGGPSERGQKSELKSVIDADARAQREFISRWTARVVGVTNARHRKMLELILGEMLEHQRVFEQAHEGRTDVLGRHSDGKVLRGEVIPVRPRD
jgi:hypothetical protein